MVILFRDQKQKEKLKGKMFPYFLFSTLNFNLVMPIGRHPMTRILVGIGILLIIAGLAWPYITKIGLFRLPGDIVVRKPNFSFYFPITTSIILSLLLTFIFWLISRIK